MIENVHVKARFGTLRRDGMTCRLLSIPKAGDSRVWDSGEMVELGAESQARPLSSCLEQGKNFSYSMWMVLCTACLDEWTTIRHRNRCIAEHLAESRFSYVLEMQRRKWGTQMFEPVHHCGFRVVQSELHGSGEL